ncbi:MAG: hypothetical protein ACOH17_12080 [Cellulomonas sp.]
MANKTEDLTLCVTGNAGMLHTVECPHLEVAALAALVPATTDQLERLPVCSSCRAILDGARRSTYSTIDQAIEALHMPMENRIRAREIAAELTFSRVWMGLDPRWWTRGGFHAAVASVAAWWMFS